MNAPGDGDDFVRHAPVLTGTGAQAAIDAAVAHARASGWALGIAVVDSFAQLIAFHRMDDARMVTIDTAIAKAQSAARMGMPSDRVRELLDGGMASASTIPGVVPLGGGMPIMWRGEMIGAIGVSGGTLPADIEVAEAGARAVTG
ncbi:MAG: hypothetical protein B7Z07_02405 [Sphingomonadales bacterium 32-67-7]|nr:MAG: hypothetical protein B7Z07_02405 [Sphingomonadales bacterium 32-67-7]